MNVVCFLSDYFSECYLGDDLVVVFFDYGGVIWVCKMVDCLKVLIVIIDKCCLCLNVVEVMNIVGNVEGKVCIIIDDIIDIVGIIIFVVKVLCEVGVIKVYVCCLYLVFLGFVMKCIEELLIEKLVVINFIVFLEEKWIDKME